MARFADVVSDIISVRYYLKCPASATLGFNNATKSALSWICIQPITLRNARWGDTRAMGFRG